MPFWSSTGPHGSFVIHFTQFPAMDFGPYARGYASAARHVAEAVLAGGFPDYQAYPAVFLYRHALELYLKGIIVKGIHLASLTGKSVVEEIAYSHDLSKLFSAAESVLRTNFPDDQGLRSFVSHLKTVVVDFNVLDKSSFVFRYPVDKQGQRPVPAAIHANLMSIAATMNSTLDQLESVAFGLDVTVDHAQEVLDIMYAAGESPNER